MDINELSEAVRSLVPTDESIFGIRVRPASIRPDDELQELTLRAAGMFSLKRGSASFRMQFAVEAAFLEELWADVSVNYAAPDDYRISKTTFLEFANTVAAPRARTYAQTLLNPLLLGAGYPPNVLPPLEVLDELPFRGEHLPEWLGPERMESLKENPRLHVPEPPPIDA